MARFYQTQYIPTKSAYVPLPYEAMAAKLQSMQAQQDQYKQNIELLDKPFGALPVDMEGAVAERERTRKQLEELRNLDYNDTANRQKIFDTIRDVRESYDPQGAKGLYQARLDQYNAARKHIQDTYKDNPTQMQFLMNDLENQFRDPNAPNDPNKLDYSKAMRKNPETGQWENTGIYTPQEWTWTDPNKYYNDTLSTIAYDTYKSSNPNWKGTHADAVKMYFLEGGDSLTKQKIDQGMLGAFRSNPDVIKTAQAQSNADETQFAIFDEKGNFKGWNTNTSLGFMLENRGNASKFYRDKTEHGTVTDRVKEEKAIEDYKNPPPLLTYREGQGLPLGTYTDNSSKLNSALSDTTSGMKAEFVQLLIAEGQSEENAKKIAGGMDIAGMRQHVNLNRNSKLKGLTDKFDSYDNQYTNLSLLDKEATAFADKQSNIDPNELNKIVKESKDPYVAKMSAEDLVDYNNANKQLSSYKGGDKSTVQNAQDTKDRIDAKYGFKVGASPDIQAVEKVYSNINNVQSKHEQAKNQYLKDNSNQRVKANWESNQNLVLEQRQATDSSGKPLFNSDGTPVMTTVVNKDASDRVNKQIDSYFVDENFNSIMTTKLNPDTGKYYTVGEYKAKKEKENADAGVSTKVEVSKPWYSQYSKVDEKGNVIKPMSVDIGGEAVEVNQNSIQVNYGNGPTSLGNLNSTPAAQTETWLANTASYGVREVPINVGSGYKATVYNAKTAGNYANNNDLKVVVTRPDNSSETLIGPRAFYYLEGLQSQGLLKAESK